MALIYIVEDDVNIREIETIALRNSGHEIEDFECARDFYEALKRKVPDLSILDIMLPDASGLNILKEIRANSAINNMPIILVTAKTSEVDMIKGLDIGADDYIKKPFSVMELITRVKALLRRSAYAPDHKTMSLGKIMIDDERHAAYVDGNLCELTYKEYELLKLLMQNAGIVLSRDTIIRNVWDVDFEGETRTVDMHIKTLRQKLQMSGSRIKTVRNVGYVME